MDEDMAVLGFKMLADRMGSRGAGKAGLFQILPERSRLIGRILELDLESRPSMMDVFTDVWIRSIGVQSGDGGVGDL
jgi:hypothetical protein